MYFALLLRTSKRGSSFPKAGAWSLNKLFTLWGMTDGEWARSVCLVPTRRSLPTKRLFSGVLFVAPSFWNNDNTVSLTSTQNEIVDLLHAWKWPFDWKNAFASIIGLQYIITYKNRLQVSTGLFGNVGVFEISFFFQTPCFKEYEFPFLPIPDQEYYINTMTVFRNRVSPLTFLLPSKYDFSFLPIPDQEYWMSHNNDRFQTQWPFFRKSRIVFLRSLFCCLQSFKVRVSVPTDTWSGILDDSQ